MGIGHIVAIELSSKNFVATLTIRHTIHDRGAVSTNTPAIHPRKNEKGTDWMNQTFHNAYPTPPTSTG